MPDLLTMALASIQASAPISVSASKDVDINIDTFYKPEPAIVSTPVETIKELKGQKYVNTTKSI